MARRSTLEILTALPRTNCRDCGLPSCLAFAAAVVAGDRALTQCPFLSPGQVEQLGATLATTRAREPDPAETLSPMKARIAALDFASAAPRLGGTLVEGRLRLHCLGRIFELDARGELWSQCHVNRWVHFPILAYTLAERVRNPSGEWVPYRELRGAASWVRFFEHRCEGPLQALAEANPGVLVDLLGVFGGRPPERAAGSDSAPVPSGTESDARWALVIRPLPKVPLLFLLWEAEDRFPAKLSLLIDRTAEGNLGAEPLYYLVSGLTEMLIKLVRRHADLGTKAGTTGLG